MTLNGLVLKCIGGLYTVKTDNEIIQCQARGRFRKDGISPCAGDQVRIKKDGNSTGVLAEVFPRKNYLVRPPISNLDKLFVISSVLAPAANKLLIDKAIAVAELSGIKPVVVFTKADLGSAEELYRIYQRSGIECCVASVVSGEGVQQVRQLAQDGICAFIGNSGVGKSSLMNAAFPGLNLKTGEISQKLGRGRHTTRQVELYELFSGGYIADTPGFSTFDMERYNVTDKDQLILGFRDLNSYTGECKFSSCSHTCEKGCAVLKAVKEGKVPASRFESYVAMYNEIKGVKQWEQKSKLV